MSNPGDEYVDLYADLPYQLEELYKEKAEASDDDEAAELNGRIQALESFLAEAIGAEEGILEREFTDYVRDLAESIGAVDVNNATWVEIDWKATADNVRVDYWEAQWGEYTYLVR